MRKPAWNGSSLSVISKLILINNDLSLLVFQMDIQFISFIRSMTRLRKEVKAMDAPETFGFGEVFGLFGDMVFRV